MLRRRLFILTALVAMLPLGASLVRGAPPQLLLKDERLAQIHEQEKTDPLMSDLLAKIRVQAVENISLPLNTYSSGGASKGDMLLQARAAASRIITSAFAYRLDGDERYFESARRDLLNVSGFPDWNPRHYLDTAEMGFGVAVGYTWLYDKLAAADREVIENALFHYLLSMAPAAYNRSGRSGLNWAAFSANSDKTTNNWNFVCNGGFVAAALALRDAHPDLAKIVLDGARDSLPLAMAGYAPDGAWAEGPTYWSYGTGYLVNTLAMLAAETQQGDADLVRLPGFGHTLSYVLQIFGPSGISFNFGDGGPMRDTQANSPAQTWLAHRFSMDGMIPEIRRLLRKKLDTPPSGYARSLPRGTAGRGSVYAAIFFPEDRADASGASLPLDAHFRGGSDFVVMRSRASDPDALWIALKGGRNGISHGHLDLGSFVLDAGGLRWAVDLGSENYGLPGYWEKQDGGRRWNYFRLNNHSHNTITLGGALQSATAVAPIVNTQLATSSDDAPGTPSATVDLTQAYPGLSGKLLRHASMPERSAILIEDEVTGLLAGKSIDWRMLTPARVSLSEDGQTATLSQGGKTLKAELSVSPPQAAARFTTVSAQPPTKEEKQNGGITLLAVSFTPDGMSANTPLRLSVRFNLAASGED